jgi:hypothetical protein
MGLRSWLSKAWRMTKRRLNRKASIEYCIGCGSCGEDGCCKAEICQGGPFCFGYYGPVTRGPVKALVALRREAEEYGALMSPQLVKLAPGEVSPHKDTIYGWPMPEGMREETWDEYRARIADRWKVHEHHD